MGMTAEQRETFEARCTLIQTLWEQGYRLDAICEISGERDQYVTNLASKKGFRRPEGYSARYKYLTVEDYRAANTAPEPASAPPSEYMVSGSYCRPCQRRVLNSEAVTCRHNCARKRMCQ